MPFIRVKAARGSLLAPLLVMACASVALAQGTSEPATGAAPIDFTLVRRSGTVMLELTLRDRHDLDTHFSTAPTGLAGLDPAHLDGGPAPVRFAMVREPGRFDCTGEGEHGRATGRCSFTPDAGFADFLAAHGIARPSVEQSQQMTTTGVGRALVQAITEAHYPTPTPGQLAGLAALGVDQAYIGDLASRGYRPARIDDLLGLKAIGATPAYIDGLRRSGYRRLDAETMMQFRALNVTPAYLTELAAAGYGSSSPSEVAQLRALGVDGNYIKGFQAAGQAHPSVDQLVRMKALGVSPADVRAAAAH